MKQPLWKIWLSHINEFVIERGATELNPDLQLGLKKGRYCLSTPNAIYSYGDLYDNFSKAFKAISVDQLPIKNVLVLGFGLGSIPLIIERQFNKIFQYTGVEADELIATWASQYVLNELQSPIQMHLTDASIYVEISSETFDLIAVDLFIDNEVPTAFESVSFLKKTASLLNEGGLLLFNRLSLRPSDKKVSKLYFEEVFQQVFPAARYLDFGGNWMLLSH